MNGFIARTAGASVNLEQTALIGAASSLSGSAFICARQRSINALYLAIGKAISSNGKNGHLPVFNYLFYLFLLINIIYSQYAI